MRAARISPPRARSRGVPRTTRGEGGRRDAIDAPASSGPGGEESFAEQVNALRSLPGFAALRSARPMGAGVGNQHRNCRDELGGSEWFRDHEAVRDALRRPLVGAVAGHINDGQVGHAFAGTACDVPAVRPLPKLDVGNDPPEPDLFRVQFSQCLGSIADSGQLEPSPRPELVAPASTARRPRRRRAATRWSPCRRSPGRKDAPVRPDH